MMKLKNGEIIPGIGISNISLGITKEELIHLIGIEYEEEIFEFISIIIVENAKFWFTNDGKLYQIGVSKDFQGKYKNVIGIGSTLKEVKEKFGDYNEEHNTYEIENDKGMCFELEDVDYDEEWDELTAPIEYIYVYRVGSETLK
ncbi:hypothetical protein [Anaeromicropila populeti]|uniref:Uncharacterized protein n=1 Tax=Anaeromicropila populeti TaxID=37658 RepID=A0A1I6IS00_9FIRM|nr:hypothetical protein [Anaeromicropila populeti]SFR69503.1 hypothetical protein SAMN05661086_01106 [Anaeromicropila populeti]